VAGQTLVLARAPGHPKLLRKGGRARVVEDDGATTSPTRRAVRVGDEGSDTVRGAPAGRVDDPIARVLSELERQRLASRPVRISSQTGLPTLTPRGKREPTPHTVPRPTPPTEPRRGRPPSGPGDALPQQFRPVQASADPTRSVDGTLQWAVDTAWQHVPCELALVLELDDDDGRDGCRAEVLAARGAHEREARGCFVGCAGAPLQLGHAPSLVRFPTGRALTFTAADGSTWELAVTSSLVVPVEAADGELTGLGLGLVNCARDSGFTDSELRAVAYLARTFAQALG